MNDYHFAATLPILENNHFPYTLNYLPFYEEWNCVVALTDNCPEITVLPYGKWERKIIIQKRSVLDYYLLSFLT